MSTILLVVDATTLENFESLSKHRIPAAIPFGGKYRLIDFALSNAKNSEIINVSIFPNGNYRSLTDHIGSGDKWDLDRRRDGIFILPPKNNMPGRENIISFQRMYEHIEYFRRSSQEYAIITPATLVWNVDYNLFVENHIKSGAQITEILSSDNKRLNTFVIAIDKLMEYIESYSEIIYRNIADIFDYDTTIKVNNYHYDGYVSYVRTVDDYYKVSMDILKDDIADSIFNTDRKIYSKETNSHPTYYGENATSKNSIIASGAFIEGEVINSIISRKVMVKKGSVVKNSILMNETIVEENAYVENCVLDKETKVMANSYVKQDDNLFVSEKKQKVYGKDILKIVQVASECSPYIKTGGLADVVGSLTDGLKALGADSRCFLPLHKKIKDNYFQVLKEETTLEIDIEGTKTRVQLYSLIHDGAIYYFIDLYKYFERDKLYGYEDDGIRYGYFSKCVLEFLKKLSFIPDCINIHDWHPSLIPSLMKKYPEFEKTSTLLTIHNIAYQGIFPKKIIEDLDVDYYVSGDTINFLEVGINTASKISTVSNTYIDELKYQYYSLNLNDAILRRERDLYGIVNGLDSKYSPSIDPYIKAKYDLSNYALKKQINKEYLKELCGFSDGMIIGMVTRIVEMKGFEIIINALDEILYNMNINFVLLGTGDKYFEERLLQIQERHPNKMKLFLTYDGTNPSYVYAGADAFLMPSRIEPCGIGQMIALRYGTIPIVRQTGGLNDTVDSFDSYSKSGNGFKFYNYDSRDLVYTVRQAYTIYENDKDLWNRLIENAMNSDNSLEKSVRKYLNLYQTLKKY